MGDAADPEPDPPVSFAASDGQPALPGASGPRALPPTTKEKAPQVSSHDSPVPCRGGIAAGTVPPPGAAQFPDAETAMNGASCRTISHSAKGRRQSGIGARGDPVTGG